MKKLIVFLCSALVLILLTSTTWAASLAQTLPLEITGYYPNSILPNGNVGASYYATFSTTGGGARPVTWSIISGRLPSGLSIIKNWGNSSTAITGTPTRIQTSTFTIQARDKSGNRATHTYTLTINGSLPPVITNPSSVLPDGAVGAAYATNLFANGGVQPYRWEISAGQLPPGLQLSGNQITGTPTSAGTFVFTARVTDSIGAQASQEFSITVN